MNKILLGVVFLFVGCSTMRGGHENKAIALSDNKSPASAMRSSIAQPNEAPAKNIPAAYDKAYLYRTDLPYKAIMSIPKNTDLLRKQDPDEYVRQTAEIIKANSRNEFEEVKMAHDLVAITLKYDDINFWSNTIPDQSYKNVLISGVSVCEGYANLFKKYCDELQIPSAIIHGFARGVGTSPMTGNQSIKSNHAWNMVEIEAESYLVDCTWDSGYMNGRVIKSEYTTDWLFLKPEHCIYTHYPEYADQQLLSMPLNQAQFSELPFLWPKYFDVVGSMSFPLQRINKVDNGLKFTSTIKNGHQIIYQVISMQTGKEILNCTFTQQNENGKTDYYFSFPLIGEYLVNVFCRKSDSSSGVSCGEFIVQTSSSNTTVYPTLYTTADTGISITSPIEMPLIVGRQYLFQVRTADKKAVKIFFGHAAATLKQTKAGVYETMFTIPKDISELSIGISNSEQGQYEIIAKYGVLQK